MHKSSMASTGIRYIYSKGETIEEIDSILSPGHFNLEKDFFEKYELCPNQYDEFILRYVERSPLVVGSAYQQNMLLGFKVWQKIGVSHYHCHISVVGESHHNLGISKTLSLGILKHIGSRTEIYLTKICTPSAVPKEIEANVFELVSNPVDPLSDLERKLISKVIRIIDHSRTVSNFYKLKNGESEPTHIKVYKEQRIS